MKLFSNKKGWVWIVWGVAAAIAGAGYLINAFKPAQPQNMTLIYILIGIIVVLLLRSFSK